MVVRPSDGKHIGGKPTSPDAVSLVERTKVSAILQNEAASSRTRKLADIGLSGAGAGEASGAAPSTGDISAAGPSSPPQGGLTGLALRRFAGCSRRDDGDRF